MAWYTEAAHLQAEKVTQVWTDTHGPAEKVQASGIYRCKGCKREVTCNKNDPFPPQSHHQHAPHEGDISLALSGTGKGWDLGVDGAAFTISRR